MAIYIELGALIAAIVILYLLHQFLKNPLLIIANSVLGFIALIALNAFLHLGIAINLWSLLVVAFGGIGGLILVIILHLLGLGF
ncbi:MAG: pro-sigmaK processing inhibitor BofA family protein [Candidatus Micrarchaeota archaeon]